MFSISEPGAVDRIDPLDAARAFVDAHFPECSIAFVAGSVLRGDGTSTSDLDIVILTDRPEAPFRASYREFGWPIEVFVHNQRSLRRYFDSGLEERRPSLQMMCWEGVVVCDRDGQAAAIQREAGAMLEKGPPPLTPEEIDRLRYAITDSLDDLIGCENPDEGVFIAHQLAVTLADFVLGYHGRWRGTGKWVVRALAALDGQLAADLAAATRAYCQRGEKQPLVALADAWLQPVGGRLFEGYYSAGVRDEDS